MATTQTKFVTGKDLKNVVDPELKNNIRTFLQNIMANRNGIKSRLLALQSKYLSQEQGQYGRNFLNYGLSASQPYFKLEMAHEAIKNNDDHINMLTELYEELQNIIYNEILNTSGDFTYVFYYRDTEGVYRIESKELKGVAGHVFGKKSLVLTRSSFAKAYAEEIQQAKEQQQKAKFIASHFKDLKDILTKESKIKTREAYLSEALERDLQLRHSGDLNSHSKWTKEEAEDVYIQSLGNDPWYTGGDLLSSLLNIQVKSFMQKGSDAYRMVSVTSHNSLEGILNYLISFLSVTNSNLEAKVEEAYRVFSQNVDSSFEKAAEKVSNTCVELKNQLKAQ